MGIEMKLLIEEVQANHRRLANCDRHAFEAIEPGPRGSAIPRRVQCTRCEGVISGHDWYWFKKGLEQGRKQ